MPIAVDRTCDTLYLGNSHQKTAAPDLLVRERYTGVAVRVRVHALDWLVHAVVTMLIPIASTIQVDQNIVTLARLWRVRITIKELDVTFIDQHVVDISTTMKIGRRGLVQQPAILVKLGCIIARD